MSRSPRVLLVLLAVFAFSFAFGAYNRANQPTEAAESYVTKMNAAQEKFARKTNEVDIANSDSPEDYKESLEQVIPAIDAMADEMDGLQPPSEVAAQHNELVSSTREYAAVLKDNVSDLDSSDNEKADASAVNIYETSIAFAEKLYRVGTDIATKLKIPTAPVPPGFDPEASEKQPSSSTPETQPAA